MSILHCDECGERKPEVRIKCKAGSIYDIKHVCTECAGRILSTSFGWEVFDIDKEVIDRFVNRLNTGDLTAIRAMVGWEPPLFTKKGTEDN